ITGSATTTSWPTVERPSSETRRNSRGPSGASAAAVILSLAEPTRAFASFGGGPGTTSAVRPAPSKMTDATPLKFICPSTVTSAVVPRCTATGVQWVSIGKGVWARAEFGTERERTPRSKNGRDRTINSPTLPVARSPGVVRYGDDDNFGRLDAIDEVIGVVFEEERAMP